MAWRSIGKNNSDMINQLKAYGVIKTDLVAQAMKATDRQFYCSRNPYMDAPQSIGFSVTISAPHMHAYALELLKDHMHPNGIVLDVGSGSGYLTASFARIMNLKGDNSKGVVVGVEHQSALAKQSRENINKDDPTLLSSGRVVIIEGDGRQGCSEYAPFDAIHVGAASAKTPDELINQLKPGGRLIVPIGPEGDTQYLEQFDKDERSVVTRTRLMGVMFVPLTDLSRS